MREGKDLPRFLTIETGAVGGFCQLSEVEQNLKRTEIDFQARKGDAARDDSGSLSEVSVSSSLLHTTRKDFCNRFEQVNLR